MGNEIQIATITVGVACIGEGAKVEEIGAPKINPGFNSGAFVFLKPVFSTGGNAGVSFRLPGEKEDFVGVIEKLREFIEERKFGLTIRRGDKELPYLVTVGITINAPRTDAGGVLLIAENLSFDTMNAGGTMSGNFAESVNSVCQSLGKIMVQINSKYAVPAAPAVAQIAAVP